MNQLVYIDKGRRDRMNSQDEKYVLAEGKTMSEQQKDTTAATVVSKESLLGKRNTETAIELYQLIDDRDFDSIREIANIVFSIAMHKNTRKIEEK